MLRVLGDDFLPDEFLADSRLPVYAKFMKGIVSEGRLRPSKTSGFSCEVGSDSNSLRQHIEEAELFLKEYKTDLERLAAVTTLESVYLDFAVDCRLNGSSVVVQCDCFPASFLKLAGNLGIGVCYSLYSSNEIETESCD